MVDYLIDYITDRVQDRIEQRRKPCIPSIHNITVASVEDVLKRRQA